jgi:VWFA-related protein
MKRANTWACALLLLVLTPSARAASAPAAVEPSIRSFSLNSERFPELEATLTVFGRDGVALSGLTTQTVAVEEGGQKVVGPTISSEELPVAAAVLLDTSGSMVFSMRSAKTSLEACLGGLQASDKAMLIEFSHRPSVAAELGTDHKKLLSALDGLKPTGSTSLFDAIGFAMEELKTATGAKVVLALTDGQYQSFPGDTSTGTSTLATVVQRAKESGIPVYAVGIGMNPDRKVLESLAKDTGGKLLDASKLDKLKAVFKEAVNGRRLRYKIAFKSPQPKPDGKERALLVKITKDGKTTKADAKYSAPAPPPPPPTPMDMGVTQPDAGGGTDAPVPTPSGPPEPGPQAMPLPEETPGTGGDSSP